MKVETPVVDDYDFLTILNLFFLPNTKCWNVDLINALFNERDARAITSIPCNFRSSNDTCIWNVSKDGCY